jgi:hypothetical protein
MALSEKQRIAVHEAGHAVVAWILGQRMRSIRIYAESNRKTPGYGVVFFRKDTYGHRARGMLTEVSESCPDIVSAIDIVVLFAGELAQALSYEEERREFEFEALETGARDRQRVDELLAAMNCTDDQQARRSDQLWRLSADYVGQHLEHVAHLAHALLANGRILKAKEIRQLLGPRTMPLRTAIEAVRSALQPETGSRA